MAQTDYIRKAQIKSLTTNDTRQPPVEPVRARKKSEKVYLALEHLERIGITGSQAYGPLAKTLLAIGLPTKPMYFRSMIGMFIWTWLILSVNLIGTAWICLSIKVVPGPVATLIEAGPGFFVVLVSVLSLAGSIMFKLPSWQGRLPHWKDL
ncbi:DUF6404 family protein [uncultured Shimia sp.]|uniref:DUF6404 family protein n=1 Tax=uncultured Shimia sp. TaxID=573152 RepID=UPI0025D60BA4|nr:DUF6404 family protein [uncultured Shimia sp.]